MAVIKRQWRAWLAVVVLLVGVFLLWDRKTFGHTPADETISVATTFASLDGGVHDADPTAGVVEIDGNLTIAAGGSPKYLEGFGPKVDGFDQGHNRKVPGFEGSKVRRFRRFRQWAEL